MNMKSLLASLCVAAALAACGGNNDNDATSDPTAQAPGSASASSQGFVDYLKALLAADADTLPPVDVSAVTPPADDIGLPADVK